MQVVFQYILCCFNTTNFCKAHVSFLSREKYIILGNQVQDLPSYLCSTKKDDVVGGGANLPLTLKKVWNRTCPGH